MKSVGAIAVPTFPKYDEKDRKKWCADYDKAESEVLRGFMGNDTVTLGLRVFSTTDFDRRIPDPDEPTIADKMEASRAAMRRPRRQGEPQARAATSEPWRAPAEDVTNISTLSPIRKQHRSFSPSNVSRCVGLDCTFNTAADETLGSSNDSLKSVEKCSRLLDTLLNPQPQFRTSFRLQLEGVDLCWMWSYTADRAPQSLLTLETFREDAVSNVDGCVKSVVINSPRSTLVMLRNGVSVKEILPRTSQSFLTPEVSDESAAVFFKHFEDRRRALVTSLRQEYRDVCAAVSLHDLIPRVLARRRTRLSDTVSPSRAASRVDNNDACDSSFAIHRRAKLEQQASRSKQKLQRQLEQMKLFQAEMEEAERRRQLSDENHHRKTEEMKREAIERAAAAAKKLEELRAQTNSLNMTFAQQAEEKRRKLEEKEEKKKLILAAQREQHKLHAEQKAQEKQRRIEQSRLALQSLDQDTLKRLEEKEMRAAAMREERRKKKEAEQEEAHSLQKKAEQQRLEAKERARQLEANALKKAEEREQHAAAKLEAFHEAQKRHRDLAQETEKEKERKRLAAVERANSMVAQRVSLLLSRRSEHESHMRSASEMRRLEEQRNRDLAQTDLDDKRFLLQRQNKASEFKKLLQCTTLVEKQEVTERIFSQRDQLKEAAARDREILRRQREELSKMMTRL